MGDEGAEPASSSLTAVRGVESTPKGPEVKSELAAAVLAADPRLPWTGARGGAKVDEPDERPAKGDPPGKDDEPDD